jgi:hypothetical protein
MKKAKKAKKIKKIKRNELKKIKGGALVRQAKAIVIGAVDLACMPAK